MTLPAAVQVLVAGATPVVLVAPHTVAAIGPAVRFVAADPTVQAQFAAHVLEWEDVGSLEAFGAAVTGLAATGVRNALPRGLIDLNRGWRGRVEAQETLFGKGAVDRWVGENLAPGARDDVQACYRQAIAAIRTAAQGKRGMVEVHSYGELGSTYDQLNGGRPVRRSEVAVVDATPWASARPVGLAQLIPGDLRAVPWPLYRAFGDALGARGLHLGPHPYPAQAPWTLSNRFLADRWFGWLGQQGLLPAVTAARLQELAWTDEQHPDLDAALRGEPVAALDGAQELSRITLQWSADASVLGRRFVRETGVFATTVELRLDLAGRATDAGEGIGAAIAAYLALAPT